ncbi:MAG: glycoside hydrolase family 88 protein [Prevotellaceae bacterium]|jgi:unsaturated rhamnogalacturonyl hydrolase|nr:glycoside hydrolase family 88 protein [Prevotellaceae bacterium]
MKNIFNCLLFIIHCSLVLAVTGCTSSVGTSWAVRMAQSEMQRAPEAWQLDFQKKLKWDYTFGLEGQAFIQLSEATGDAKYFDYIETYADTMINDNGEIRTYKLSNYNLDHLNPGKMLFALYDKTHKEKYKKALVLLRSQLRTQPRTGEGGFWHKFRYPHQMWLDGLYMGAPFYAQSIGFFNEPYSLYDDVIDQFVIVARRTYDPATGLFRHAYDESRAQRWADPVTGQSSYAWGRSMGWFAMALVDVLDYIPAEHSRRHELITVLNTVAGGVKKYQDISGVWYQIMDLGGHEKNYLEATSSCMFAYMLLKATHKGYIDTLYRETAIKAYEGILNTFVKTDESGAVHLTQCCAVAGLGGDPYRDGSYDYYMNEPVRSNDAKGVGPFIMASLWYDSLPPTAAVIPCEAKSDGEVADLVVATDGTGNFRTIQEAVNSVRNYRPEKRTVILVKKGVYKEKLVIPASQTNISLLGEDVNQTIITWNDHAKINNMGTFRTYTVLVQGEGFIAENITFENNAEPLGQAVAVHVEADRVIFRNCRLLGNQDTLFTGTDGSRQYYAHCYIEGTTDFIFGPATAWFEECTIHSKKNSYVTAASTAAGREFGYVFNRCTLTAAAGIDSVHLGRPWRPHAAVVFMHCTLGIHIVPAGWDNWRNPDNEKTARYAEYKNTGPGAPVAGRVGWSRQLTDAKAATYTLDNIFTRNDKWEIKN